MRGPKEWAIRPKGERDAEAIVTLIAEVAREGSWIATEWPFDVAQRTASMRAAIVARVVLGWVAVDASGAVVGDLTVFDAAADAPQLGMIVTATQRGRGIGRALLETATAWARQNAKPALELKVFPHNGVALALYRGSGFIETGFEKQAYPRRDGSVLDAIVMRKPLDVWST